jgi:hypothetical protein
MRTVGTLNTAAEMVHVSARAQSERATDTTADTMLKKTSGAPRTTIPTSSRRAHRSIVVQRRATNPIAASTPIGSYASLRLQRTLAEETRPVSTVGWRTSLQRHVDELVEGFVPWGVSRAELLSNCTTVSQAVVVVERCFVVARVRVVPAAPCVCIAADRMNHSKVTR